MLKLSIWGKFLLLSKQTHTCSQVTLVIQVLGLVYNINVHIPIPADSERAQNGPARTAQDVWQKLGRFYSVERWIPEPAELGKCQSSSGSWEALAQSCFLAETKEYLSHNLMKQFWDVGIQGLLPAWPRICLWLGQTVTVSVRTSTKRWKEVSPE